MKKIKLIQDILDKAHKKTESASSYGEFIYKRKQEEVYRVIVSGDKHDLTLYHYGVLILKVIEKNKVFSGDGAYSQSDRTAINNALYWLGIDDYFCAFKKGDKVRVWQKCPVVKTK